MFAAVHPDMVQHFRARIVTPSRVLLEWKPPSRPGVAKYKVSVSIIDFLNGKSGHSRHACASVLILHVGLYFSKYRSWTEIRVIVSDGRKLFYKSLIIFIFWPILHFSVRGVIKSQQTTLAI